MASMQCYKYNRFGFSSDQCNSMRYIHTAECNTMQKHTNNIGLYNSKLYCVMVMSWLYHDVVMISGCIWKPFAMSFLELFPSELQPFDSLQTGSAQAQYKFPNPSNYTRCSLPLVSGLNARMERHSNCDRSKCLDGRIQSLWFVAFLQTLMIANCCVVTVIYRCRSSVAHHRRRHDEQVSRRSVTRHSVLVWHMQYVGV